MSNTCTNKCSSCTIHTDAYAHTRRCFMTGEYCSQLVNIRQERERLHEVHQETFMINAFVIMNFSDMSDVVYEWRIKPFIESLEKYFTYDAIQKTLTCHKDEQQNPVTKEAPRVKIQVIRSDTDPASNYVVCNRICQQLQIADLVIVDVSSQNPNVFYEFGMAVALGKMILPICYSGSFFKMVKPFDETRDDIKEERLSLEGHLGCYPWRKTLFEYFGIVYKHKKPPKRPDKEALKKPEKSYFEYEEAVQQDYCFDDKNYDRFPYDEEVTITIDNETKTGKIGELIYDRLKTGYNEHGPESNTLIVYTMESFLNRDEAGKCIVNFYNFITYAMKASECFCGERVGVLVQNHPIPESDKDTKDQTNLLYNTGEIIHIGVNDATYKAMERKVKAADQFAAPDDSLRWYGEAEYPLSDIDIRNAKRNAKEHSGNRGIIIYPKNPVYVARLKSNMDPSPLSMPKTRDSGNSFFCLYYVMLNTLRYVNELVVDISDNSLQALFWLGAAHGSDIYAITVIHEYSDKELALLVPEGNKRRRNVFDVAGLWAAYYYSHDTKGFYEQLRLAQLGIERHSRLMLSETESNKQPGASEEPLVNEGLPAKALQKKIAQSRPSDVVSKSYDRNDEIEEQPPTLHEYSVLESYYRRRFWSQMLRYNRFKIYLRQCDDIIISANKKHGSNKKEAKIVSSRIPKWDFDAVSRLTNYLSTHTVVGEYRIVACSGQDEITDQNFMCVGGMSSAYMQWTERLERKMQNWATQPEIPALNVLHERCEGSVKNLKGKCHNCNHDTEAKQIGFKLKSPSSIPSRLLTNHLDAPCSKCVDRPETFTQIAQLILWREDGDPELGQSHYNVALNGTSGPATYALSALFVEDKNKLEQPNEESPELGHPKARTEFRLLCDLQEIVREKFFHYFLNSLKTALMNTNELEAATCQSILCTVSMYLSTMLYRYFFPFLSYRDRARICNDLETYIYPLMADNISPFEKKKGVSFKHLSLICSKLKEALNSFKGIEAFFDVTVGINSKPSDRIDRKKNRDKLFDDRMVTGISLRKNNGKLQPVYFFIESEPFDDLKDQ